MEHTTTRSAKAKLDYVLGKLQGVKAMHRTGQFTARCPVHADSENSLIISFDEESGRIGVFCFAGCTPKRDPHRLDRFLEATGLIWADLQPEKEDGRPAYGSAYERYKAGARKQASDQDGGDQEPAEDVTLADLADEKKINIHLLDNLYVEDGFKWAGRKCIKIPYFTSDGEEHARFRVRVGLSKKGKRFMWGGPSNIPPIAYGLNFLPMAREQKRIIITEGESDVWTLVQWKYAAIGLPGAEHTDKLLESYLDGIETVYVIDEQDGSGAASFVRGLKQRLLIDFEFKGVVRVVQLRSLYDVKDPNELNVKLFSEKKQAEFRALFDAALECAIRIQDWIDPSADDTIPHLVSASFVMNLPPVKFLIDGLLPEASLSMILGKEGSGKSFLSLDWACCVATGSAWNGRNCGAGTVIYIASEGLPGYKNRLKVWLQHNGPEKLEALASNLYYVQGTIDMIDAERRKQLLDAIAGASAPRLVIIDTLAESMPGGDENSSKDMGVILAASREIRKQIGAAVLVVHHKPKNGEGSRGHSSLPGALDMRFELECDPDDQALITVSCTKARDVEKLEPLLFRREKVFLADGESEYDSSCVLVPAEVENPAQEFANSTQAQMYAILEALGRTTSAQFRERCLEVGISNGSFYTNIKAMVQAGLIVKEEIGQGKKAYYSVAPPVE